jgi:hypothetical protein
MREFPVDGVPRIAMLASMAEPKCTHPALRAARDHFSGFYRTAKAEDAALMDNLVLAYLAYRQAVTMPREFVPANYRFTFERACDNAERKFLQARDRLREGETFKKLVPDYQQRIADLLFDASPARD